jgi:hypothetical protein
MSWRTGSKLFLEMWPAIKANIGDREERVRFTAALVRVFVHEDIDTWDIEDVDPDIRAAIVQGGYDICEPERYPAG